MIRVHIRMNLENETCKVIFLRIYHTFDSLYRTRRRSNLDKAVEQLLDAESVER